MGISQTPQALVPATLGASDNFTLLNTGGTALTGATTITVSGISGKNRLYVWVDSLSCASTGLSYVTLRLNTDTGSNYYEAGFKGQTNNTVGPYNSNGEVYYMLGRFDRSTTANYCGIQIDGCNSTGIKTISTVSGMQAYNNSGEFSLVTVGHYTGSSAITSVSLYTLDGQNFDNGTMYVYGA